MSDRSSKIRKRSEEEILETKKQRQITTETNSTGIMAETSTNALSKEAKDMIKNLHIVTIEESVSNAMEKCMNRWNDSWMENPRYKANQLELVDNFVVKCSALIDSAIKKTEVKVDKLEEVTIEHDKRLTTLEKMADDFDQSKRSCNIVIRGLCKEIEPLIAVTNMVTTALGIHITQNNIKYLVKLNLKNEKENTVSAKVAFFDQRLRDEIYSRRLKLKGTSIYISEDLTQKKSSLAYEARQHVKNTQNTSTWTVDGTVFLKDSLDGKPRAIHDVKDIPRCDASATTSMQTRTY